MWHTPDQAQYPTRRGTLFTHLPLSILAAFAVPIRALISSQYRRKRWVLGNRAPPRSLRGGISERMKDGSLGWLVRLASVRKEDAGGNFPGSLLNCKPIRGTQNSRTVASDIDRRSRAIMKFPVGSALEKEGVEKRLHGEIPRLGFSRSPLSSSPVGEMQKKGEEISSKIWK